MRGPDNDNHRAMAPERDTLVTCVLLWLLLGPVALVAMSATGILWHASRLTH